MLVETGQEHRLVTNEPVKTRQEIGHHGGVGGADVRPGVGVIDGSGDVEMIGHRAVPPREKHNALRLKGRGARSWYHPGLPEPCDSSLRPARYARRSGPVTRATAQPGPKHRCAAPRSCRGNPGLRRSDPQLSAPVCIHPTGPHHSLCSIEHILTTRGTGRHGQSA